MHLWRWGVEPETREAWRRALTSERISLDGFRRMSPSLEAVWPARLASAYQDARRHATQDTGLPVETFPVRCPWVLAHLMGYGFWPGALDASSAARRALGARQVGIRGSTAWRHTCQPGGRDGMIDPVRISTTGDRDDQVDHGVLEGRAVLARHTVRTPGGDDAGRDD
jgi:hypothetical protein